MFKNFWNSLKIISASSLLLSGSFSTQHNVAMANNFSLSCKSPAVGNSEPEGRPYLIAACRNFAGKYNSTYLFLENHIANYNGNLAWARGGNFQKTCLVQYQKKEWVLVASCKRADGSSNYFATLVLDEKISNHNGVLYFDF